MRRRRIQCFSNIGIITEEKEIPAQAKNKVLREIGPKFHVQFKIEQFLIWQLILIGINASGLMLSIRPLLALFVQEVFIVC